MNIAIDIALAAALGIVGYVLGPNSAFAALVALVLIFLGMRASERRALAGWSGWAAVCAGQWLVVGLVLARAVPDLSLVRLIVPGHPDWHHAAAHAAQQGVFLSAFLAGKVLRRRYARMVGELDEALRAVSLREALLTEARADYRRACEKGRKEARTSSGLPEAPPETPPAPLPEERPEAPEVAVVVSRAWGAAFVSKMHSFHLGVTALCTGGAVLLGFIARERLPLHVAWACMGGAALAAWLHAYLQRAGARAAYWPWSLVGLFSVGPAWSLGLHSGFAAVVATLLFFGGPFRTARPGSLLDRRGLVLGAVCAAHGGLFLLMAGGVVADLGNVPVLRDGGGVRPWLTHALVQGIYVLSFRAGQLLERRYRLLMRQLEAAARDAARAEALLCSARADLDRLLAAAGEGRGLFSGQRVGRYRVARLLGRGGMGEVYEARDEDAGRVALKLLRRDRVGDPQSLQLFEGEAAAVTRVRSPHVAAVLEVGGMRLEGGAGGDGALPFLAMEYMAGGSLSEVLRQRGRLAAVEVCDLIRDVCAGLRDIHAAGVLHRDIKPQNIMRAEAGGGLWRLVDFGVAQLLYAAGGGDEAGPMIAGTPPYMAPEQALGERVDLRADLYSFCLVVYRALTGRTSFSQEDGRGELLQDVLLALQVGLALRPEDRFATAIELRDVLLSAFEGRLAPTWRARGEALSPRGEVGGGAGDRGGPA